MQSSDTSRRLPESVSSQEIHPEQMFAGVALMPAENQQLLIIENYFAAASDDRNDVLIRLQKLSMTVTNRILSFDIETAHLMVNQASPPDRVVNRCQEETLRIDRDTRMIAAAQELISLYSADGLAAPSALP